MHEEKEMKNYKYDAFISYRHTELDQFIAEKIQKYLEEFKLPKNIKDKKGLKKTKIERVFRDKEELTITNNLEDPIIQALKGSEYLIVICSPRTKESIWCRKEIEKFIEFHGHQKILTVLIEGQPSEAFPEELLYEEEVVKENGIDTLHRKDIEPLAADIRAKSKGEMCKLLKTELLRVIAPMFGLEYDDLRQRHRERRIKRIITATVSAAVIGAAVGVAGIASALIINGQKEKIQEQNDKISNQKLEIEEQNQKLLYNQANSLADNSMQYLSQDRVGEALETAMSSVTNYEGIKMPYTPAGRYALTMALRPYDTGRVYKAKYQLEVPVNIEGIKLSDNKNYLLIIDRVNCPYVWDLTTGELLIKLEDACENIEFVGESKLIYTDKNNSVKLVNFIDYEEKIIYEDIDYLPDFKATVDGAYIAIIGSEKLEVYDVSNEKIICQITVTDGSYLDAEVAWCEDKLVYLENSYSMVNNVEQIISILNVYDIHSKEIIQVTGEFNDVSGIKLMDGIFFITGGIYDNNSSNSGFVMAVDEKTGEIIWQNKYKDIMFTKMYVEKIVGQKNIFVASHGEFYCINGDTGAEYISKDVSEGIADFTVGEGGVVNLLSCNGNLFVYNSSKNEMFNANYLFECNVGNIFYGYFCDEGVVILPTYSNYIVKYEKVINSDREQVAATQELEDLFFGFIDYDKDFVEEAESLGIPNPKLVEYVSYIDDNNIALITYLNKSLDIYDVETKEVIKSIDNVECAPIKDFGTDAEGNRYVMGEICGYCFDKDYNILAVIDNMVYVDVEEGYIIVGEVMDELWKYPIYSFNQLMDMALNKVK